jgi:hypothetical protein
MLQTATLRMSHAASGATTPKWEWRRVLVVFNRRAMRYGFLDGFG